MGKPRRAAPTDQRASKDDQVPRQKNDTQQVLELIVSSMCVAVEDQASQSEQDLESSSPEPTLARIYQEKMWKQPLERALRVVNDWSLAKFQTKKSLFQREIAYPADGKPAPVDQEEGQEEEAKHDELTDSEPLQQEKSPKKQPKRQRLSAPTPPPEAKMATPELFRTAARIGEDPLEARWDHRGNPVPLRHNILGEHYAPHSDPLRFVKQNKERSPSEIYQQMKKAVRENLKDREKRRIQALNDREKLRRQRLEAQGFLSPEAALEAKFDRMFVEENNELQEGSSGNGDGAAAASLGKAEKAEDAGGTRDDGDDDDDGDDGEQEDEGDDTDEASGDSDNQQQQRRVRVK